MSPVMGPESPSDEVVDEALQIVLDVLRKHYGCLKHPEVKFPGAKNLRKHRIEKLRKAIYDMIELEYWETF